MHWVAELQWAIELIVMFNRWVKTRGIEHEVAADTQYHRAVWVRMCMRLGDGAAHTIVTRDNIGKARITDG